MIKFLFDNLRNAPGIGGPIKAAYIGNLVKGVVKDGKKSSSAKELGDIAGDELEDTLNEEANNMFDEFIMPEIRANNIPDTLVKPLKEKAIDKFTVALRKRVEAKVKEKVAEK